MKIVLLSVVCALVPQMGFADAFSIQILSTTYTTKLTTGTNVGNELPVTHTMVSADPLAEVVNYQNVQIGLASADLFAVMTHTTTAGTDLSLTNGYVTADATSQIIFQPGQNGSAAVALAFTGQFEAFYSSGAASLTDLTANTSLWSYSWTQSFQGSVPWVDNRRDPTLPRFTAALSTPETLFQADHQYALSLFASSIANGDSQLITINASGLEPTPEPASLVLIATGLVGAGVRRWRRR